MTLSLYTLAPPKFDFEGLYRSIDAMETEVRDGELVHVVPAEVIRPHVQEKKKAEVGTAFTSYFPWEQVIHRGKFSKLVPKKSI